MIVSPTSSCGRSCTSGPSLSVVVSPFAPTRVTIRVFRSTDFTVARTVTVSASPTAITPDACARADAYVAPVALFVTVDAVAEAIITGIP